jgi:hypothetical protein
LTSTINFDLEKEIITHTINVNIFIIYIRNVIAKSIIFLRYIKLSYITNFEEKNCYYANLKNVYLATKINLKRKTLNKLIVIARLVIVVLFNIIIDTINLMSSNTLISISLSN